MWTRALPRHYKKNRLPLPLDAIWEKKASRKTPLFKKAETALIKNLSFELTKQFSQRKLFNLKEVEFYSVDKFPLL